MHGVNWNDAAHLLAKMPPSVSRQIWVSVEAVPVPAVKAWAQVFPSGRGPVPCVRVPETSSQVLPSCAGSRHPLDTAHAEHWVAVPMVAGLSCAWRQRSVSPVSGSQGPPTATHIPARPGWLLQLCPVGQLPQLTGLPQLSFVVPQLLVPQVTDIGCATQPQVPGPVVLLHDWPVGQVPLVGPQATVPPHPSGAAPQLLVPQAAACERGMQTHVPSVLPSAREQVGVLAGQPPLLGPQLNVALQLSTAVPQLAVPHGLPVETHPQTPGVPGVDDEQVCGELHDPQVIVPVQPSETVPQLLLPQACAMVFGMQMQVPAVLPSAVLHTGVAGGQVPHWSTLPQLSTAVPQLWPVPQAAVTDSGVQTHIPGPPLVLLQVSFGAVVQLPHEMRAQPLVPPTDPQLFVPQSAMVGQFVVQVFGVPVHDWPVGQVATPQVTVVPQLLTFVPQVSPAQVVAIGSAVQPHVPGVPAVVLLQVRFGGVVQLPQDTVPPHPSGAELQLLVPHAAAAVFGVQPQTFGLLGVPPPQVWGAVQVPQVSVGQPAVATVPQLSGMGQAVGQAATQVPAVPPSAMLQFGVGAEQVPHGTVPPHPSDAVPQLLLPQAAETDFGWQTQVPSVLESGMTHAKLLAQDPQLTLPPHPSGAVPQRPPASPQAWDGVLRTQESTPTSGPASTTGCVQSRLISATRKNVFMLLRQS
jgi:hypothetical protein